MSEATAGSGVFFGSMALGSRLELSVYFYIEPVGQGNRYLMFASTALFYDGMVQTI